MPDERSLIERVASNFGEGLIVPVLGAGCSARQTDNAGRRYEGFPLAPDFADSMRRRHGYLRDATDFYSATVMIEGHDGPASLINELIRAYSPAQSLPAYKTLSLLPFDAA